MSTVIINCNDYSQDNVLHAVEQMFSELGGIEKFFAKGESVLLKANMVRKIAPDRAATTHPELICALTKVLVDFGCHVVVGDSAGGVYTKQYMQAVYSACQLDTAVQYGATMNENFAFTSVMCDGKVMKKFDCIDAFLNADKVINVAKFKTHCLTGFSGCVKNLYGIIPGLLKVELHARFSDLNPFCDCLIDIEQYAKDKVVLNVLDGIIGMHKDGPTAGEPYNMGKLIASPNAHYADIVAQQMFCNPLDMPVVKKAVERGIVQPDLSDVDMDLTKIAKLSDFVGVKSVGSMALYSYPKFLRGLVKAITSQKAIIVKKECKGCGKCEVHCPNKAIDIKKKIAHIKQSQCIKCYCCQELCPFYAVKMKKPFFYRLFRRLSGKN